MFDLYNKYLIPVVIFNIITGGNQMDLQTLGWNDFFKETFFLYQEKGFHPGRVISRTNNNYVIICEEKLALAKITGKFRYNTQTNKDFPTVGDWVALEMKKQSSHLLIHAVLPRENAFVRKSPISGGRKLKEGVVIGGKTEEQIIASNINTAFIVIGLDNNFELRRIERYLTLVFHSNINPVIILNKLDLCFSLDDYIKQVKDIAGMVPVHPISAEKGMNMDVFSNYLLPGKTVVFLGSSGVGKSTITNYLLGDEKQKKQSISKSTGKGRHTTTSVELILHHSNGMIIDTPGVRELQLWGDEEILDQSFEDIKQLIYHCKFNNCHHQKEPGCAIQKAIEDNLLSRRRFESYQKQLYELKRLRTKRRDFEKKLNKK